MKIECSVGSSDIAERAILGVILAGCFLSIQALSDPLTERNVLFWGYFGWGVVLVNSGCICGRGATL